MATSERILTPIASAADTHRVSPHRLTAETKPALWQAFLDLAAISLGLAIVSSSLGGGIIPPFHDFVPLISVALMITTLLAFTGAYQRQSSPLDIRQTEGVVRGLICASTLVLIGGLGTRFLPVESTLLTAGAVSLLLILQREFTHALRARRAWRDKVARETALDSHAGLHAEIFVIGTPTDPVVHPSSASSVLKRTLDVAIASLTLLAISPLWLIVAVLIRIDSRGPVLIRQRRIGRWGIPFEMWKFRSMYADVNRYARSPVTDSDPRLTRVGRRLRRLSIDELPQLLNVLQGHMSLVGPRPEMPFIVEKYQPHERLRLGAVPGITGIWQISPARAHPIHENVQLDLFYIENRNIFLDLAILLRTVTAVVRGIGAT